MTTKPFYYIDGAITGSESLAVSAGFRQAPENDSSVILIKSGDDWGCHSVKDDLVISISFCPDSRTLVGLGKHGLLRRVSTGASKFNLANIAGRFETLKIGEQRRRGPLERVRFIQGTAYACGWAGQVYRVDGNGVHDMSPAGADDVVFTDIAGPSSDCLYAVGLAGALWHFDGRRWRQLKSPTAANIHCALYRAAGELIIGGAQEALYLREGPAWRGLTTTLPPGNIWAIAEMSGECYIAPENQGLMTLREKAFTPVANAPVTTAHRLVGGCDRLLAITHSNLVMFDGASWAEISCPENT